MTPFPVRRAFSLPKAGHAPAENEDAWAGPLPEASSPPRALRAAVADGATESAFAGVWARALAQAALDAPPECFEAPEASSLASPGIAEGQLSAAEGAPPDTLWRGLLGEAREAFAREVGPRLAGLPWYAAAKAEHGAHATLLALRIEGVETVRGGRRTPFLGEVASPPAGSEGGPALPPQSAGRAEGLPSRTAPRRGPLRPMPRSPNDLLDGGGSIRGGGEAPTPDPLGTWQALAVGDAVLFHLRAGALVQAWPLDTPEAFSNRPPLVSSRPGSRGPAPLRAQGTWQRGDAFALVTDALAAHLLTTNPADALAPHSPEAFAGWVARAREAGLRNDDVTLIVLAPSRPPPEPS